MILMPFVPIVFVAEAVRPVPGPISRAQELEGDSRAEVLELPRAARERCGARARHSIELHMAKRNVVAWVWRNEHYVTAERSSSRGTRIDNCRAGGGLLQGRFRERAEPAREPRVLVAVLVSVEGSGTRGVLAVVARVSGS